MRRLIVLMILVLAGCQHLLDRTDRQVYTLIDQRQTQTLGIPADSRIAPPDASVRPGRSAYQFVPSPRQPEIPADFIVRPTTQPTTQPYEYLTTSPTTQTATQPGQPQPLQFSLADSLRYAFGHSREFQTAKEALYLTALDLTLERYLWTPRWVATLEAKYDYVRDFDRSMEAVATIAVEQKLPYGGKVTARVIDTLMRDIGSHITKKESAELSVEAQIPLLRGAGKTAYESRYQAERSLVYAVRQFERFRRTFAVQIASDFFNLVESRQRIINAQKSVDSNQENYRRATAMFDAGRATPLDVQRAKQEELSARNLVLNADEAYQTQLDVFKVALGMPVGQPLDLIDIDAEENIQSQTPLVSVDRAIEVAVKSRLDLITAFNRIDDAKRRTHVSRNDLLPDLDLGGRVSIGPERTIEGEPPILDFTLLEDNRVQWQGTASLALPVDKKQEINQYRKSLIEVRRAQREYDLRTDRVRSDVRRALRRVEQARLSLQIQKMGTNLAERRRAYALLAFREGILSNRDAVEAENDLLDARNDYAAAQSQLRVAMLEFRRDTGTLRVNDHGAFLKQVAIP